MPRILAWLKGLHNDESGQGLVEYLLIIAGCIGDYGWDDSGCQLHQQRLHQSGSEALWLHQLEEKICQTDRTPPDEQLHEADRLSEGLERLRLDHIAPLERCGADVPSNMQWQTVQDAVFKIEAKETAGENEFFVTVAVDVS